MAIDADTLERLVPDEFDPADEAGLDTLRLHLDRYAFAARHLRPGRALDLACGVGYGTRLLADQGAELEEIVGVDLSEEAVAYARQHYAGGDVRFEAGDAMQWGDAAGFDSIVSLETIEHVPDPQAVFARLVGMLRPGGRFISSVPTTPSVDLNVHHLHDFTARSFRSMGAAQGLRELDALTQVQRVSPFEALRGQRFKRENLRPGLPVYYLTHPTAFAKRVATTLRHGFANLYLTVVWERPA